MNKENVWSDVLPTYLIELLGQGSPTWYKLSEREDNDEIEWTTDAYKAMFFDSKNEADKYLDYLSKSYDEIFANFSIGKIVITEHLFI